ncbi:hypothetical protein CLV51_1021259 [Chitinophaga niastensis]|uniref:Signal transduction histidine kinase internal region domain-containing protein n=1 Tax=Chitinophaga niastensis TaxID=536980 RepID=A0A2P8HQB3_CHINA|nr:histidine kinase [Chitinophaga niastensis]PSL48392.1 hypothetical protein CLV51_1021259 [Chitinophaga niastensis]
MNNKNPYNFYRYFIHLAVSMALLLLYVYPSLSGNWHSVMAMKMITTQYGLYGFINFNLFYLLVFVLLPEPVQRRQHIRMALYIIAAILSFGLLKYLLGACFFQDQVLIKAITFIGRPKLYFTFWEYQLRTIRTGMGVALLAYGYRLFLQWRNTETMDRNLTAAVEEAHQRYERMQDGSRLLLKYLQALTPVLENEAQRDKEGVKAILIFSDLLRYMLYDKAVEQDSVPLKKELYFYQQYLELRGLLHNDQLLQLEMDGIEERVMITPLLLQAATEKHLQQQAGSTEPMLAKIHIGQHVLSLSIGSYHFKTKLYPVHA